jgi:hypothetical protein
VIYRKKYMDDLIRSLWDLSDENTQIVMSHEEGRMDEGYFFEKAKSMFSIEAVSRDKLDATFRTNEFTIYELKRYPHAIL